MNNKHYYAFTRENGLSDDFVVCAFETKLERDRYLEILDSKQWFHTAPLLRSKIRVRHLEQSDNNFEYQCRYIPVYKLTEYTMSEYNIETEEQEEFQCYDLEFIDNIEF